MREEKGTVVCIEDDIEMINLIKLILERKGFNLIGAMGGQEGLNTVRQIKPDLVLLDMMMSDIDGWEIHRRMKADAELRNIPVIIVTVLAQNTAQVKGLDINKVDDYVSKPFIPQELLQSIHKVLGIAA
ncbi:MAG: response regulator [Chloroflexota bacterium]|nr:response regulator [Chloroflexota bacterium]